MNDATLHEPKRILKFVYLRCLDHTIIQNGLQKYVPFGVFLFALTIRSPYNFSYNKHGLNLWQLCLVVFRFRCQRSGTAFCLTCTCRLLRCTICWSFRILHWVAVLIEPAQARTKRTCHFSVLFSRPPINHTWPVWNVHQPLAALQETSCSQDCDGDMPRLIETYQLMETHWESKRFPDMVLKCFKHMFLLWIILDRWGMGPCQRPALVVEEDAVVCSMWAWSFRSVSSFAHRSDQI